MQKNALEWLGLATLLGIVSATACKSSPSDEGPVPGPGGGELDGGSSPDAPPQRSAFGLDARPSNTTCIAPARPPATGAVKFERVFQNVNLQQTIALAQPPGDGTRWFAASRTGKITTFPAVNPPSTPTDVADMATLAGRPIETAQEGGFLGFAFHPDFATNGRLYVSFTTTDAGGPASEVGYLSTTNNGASFTAYTKIFSFNRPKFEHNGGGIAFTRDGYLLLGFGDGTDDTNGQRNHTFYSRILRLDVDHPDGGKAYGIPPTNPFKNGQSGEPPEVFATGLRNPFRISVDRDTGEIWVGDVGQDSYEEVNRVVAGGNYGWPCREGAHDYKATNTWLCPSTAGLLDPVAEHQHTDGGRSVTGGVVYRGGAIPGFQGTYVYGDFIKNELWGLTPDAGGKGTPVVLNETGPAIASTHFGESDDGEVYVSTILDNLIYEMVPADTSVVSTFPDRLSKTGCVDPADPKRPAAGLIGYTVNAALWSDGADKERFLAVPDGSTIAVAPDGDLDLPIGSVLVKTFSIAGKRIETRLLVRHADGDWAGYTYEWNDEQTDAVLLSTSKNKKVGAQTWSFPSRTQCTRCHTKAAGRSLGLELAQLNGDFVYATTNRLSNQLTTLEHIGMFSAPLGKPAAELPVLPDPFGGAPLEQRARAYLHGNCSMCHRPDGGAARAPMDLRFGLSFADTKTCNVASGVEDIGVPGAKIVVPGKPEQSLVSVRMHATDGNRMPPLGTRLVDERGAKLIDDWIRGATCP
ncbi:MAG: PQQ-dependent sugar dehydrogenase [Deltaproteobacteria bacterium]|nr:PQQ-dependent sugar dehydrogenase [Deltaproteobacteria bacterium]